MNYVKYCSCMVVGVIAMLVWCMCPAYGQSAVGSGIPIVFTLPQDSFVTIVVDDSRGNRVRNTIAEQQMKAGKQGH